MSKPLDDYTVADSPAFGNLIHRGPNGYWKPIYPSEVGRALKHVEADFNYKLLTGSVANYRIYPGGQLPSNHPNVEDFSSDENKVLTLKKEGTDFYWTLEVAQGGGGSGLYESNLDAAIETVSDFGGIDAGTTVAELDGQTISSILDTLLFPTSFPTNTNASVTLSNTVGLQEIGAIINVPLVTTANQGLIKLNGVTQNNWAGDITAADISGPVVGQNSLLNVTAPNGIDDITVQSHTVVEGTSGNNWTLVGTFATGPMPEDSTGSPFPSLQFTGGTRTNSSSFEGVHPIFLGNVSGGFDQRALISHSANNIQTDQTYGENAGVLHHRISIPNTMIDSRTIQVFVFNPVSGNYDEATAPWVQSQEQRTIQLQSVSYTLLTKSNSTGGSNLYRIKFI